MSPRRSPLKQAATAVVCTVLSVLLHGAVAGPYIAYALTEPPEIAGEDGPEDQSVGDGHHGDGGQPEPILSPPVPVSISMYVEPPPNAVPAPPAPEKPAAEATPAPAATSASTGTANPNDARRSDREEGEPGKESNSGVVGSPAPGKKSSCDPVDEISKLGSHHWRVDRSLVDYYASHLRELDRQASTSTHRGEDGRPDGVLIYLPRCSVLRHGGIRNGDVIHSVNGRKVHSVPQAVTTYLALRKEKNITVELTRRNGKQVTMRYRLK